MSLNKIIKLLLFPLGHVSEAQSIFYYHGQSTYSTYNAQTNNFSPSFGLSLLLSNSSLYQSAVANCENDYSCLYDTGLTSDISFGLATHQIKQFHNEIQANISK